MSKDTSVKNSKAGITAHIIASVLFVALGICLLLMDATMISTLIYSFSVLTMGVLIICFGAYYMIKYFFNKEYTKVSNYGFTMGVILVILGSLFIFKADAISLFIDALVSLVGVVLGAVMLQQAFALFHIQRSSWFISLILGIATIAASIYTYFYNYKFFDGNLYACIFMIAVGGLSLFSLLLMLIGLHDHKKDSERIYSRNVEDNPTRKQDDSIFEEEVEIPSPVEEPAPAVEEGADALFEE
ncbi:MAG: DUF308 domain-containing protein [Pseudobutyrivibrio sp.]|nr:DUF308 domain-containing protein [Pseudobutyrivibrio sp.]